MKLTFAHLEISSWRGISIGAVHWYATIKYDESTETYGLKSIKLQKPMTAKEAAIANKELAERGYKCLYNKAGTLTEGFETEEEAVRFAIKYFNEHFNGVLVKGDYGCYSAWTDIIVWPKKYTAAVRTMNKLAKEFQALNGYECKKEFASKVEAIDDRWRKKYMKLQKICKDSNV